MAGGLANAFRCVIRRVQEAAKETRVALLATLDCNGKTNGCWSSLYERRHSMNQEEKQSRRMIWELRGLWREWDPIGVYGNADADAPPDEYDNYLWPCLEQLERRVSTEDLAGYLSYIVGEYMGLGRTERVCAQAADFAGTLERWYLSKTKTGAQRPEPD